MGYGALGIRSEEALYSMTWATFWAMIDAIGWWSRITNGIEEPKTRAEIEADKEWLANSNW